SFRPDLLARLSGFTFTLPPVRERREDLGLLIASVLRKVAGEAAAAVTFTADAARALLHHAWPLNVRELEKCLSSAILFARGGCVGLEHLPEAVRGGRGERPAVSTIPAAPQLNELQRQRHEELIGLLREYDGNVTAVARSL